MHIGGVSYLLPPYLPPSFNGHSPPPPPHLPSSVSQQPQVGRASKSGLCPVEAGVPSTRLQSGCQRYGHRLLGFRALLATGQAGHKVRPIYTFIDIRR